MGTTSAILALLLATPISDTSACPPDVPASFSSTGAEAYIRGAEAEWAASIATDEAAFLERVTASRFVAVFDGQVLDRATLIAGAEKRRAGAASNTLEQLRVHLYDATAIAEGAETWTDTGSGRRTHIVWADTWVHCGGQWRLVAAMALGTPRP